jgi:hypothetical protein
MLAQGTDSLCGMDSVATFSVSVDVGIILQKHRRRRRYVIHHCGRFETYPQQREASRRHVILAVVL